MTEDEPEDDAAQGWHLDAARRLGWVTGWARREMTKAGRKLADAAAVGGAAAREVSEADDAEVGALVVRLGRLVAEQGDALDQLRTDPAFWLIIERLAALRPSRLRHDAANTTDESEKDEDG